MSLCKDCVTGVTHEGEPTGIIGEINGVKTYIALPPADGEYDKKKAILFLPDGFGLELINNKLLADDFAKNGFQTYIPDYFNGDPVFNFDANFDLQAWFAKHQNEHTRPVLDKVIDGLKGRGITEFGATGYCFGGRYVFNLAFEKIIKVGVVSHPSLLQAPQDLEKFKATGLPLLINSCEFDTQYPPESQKRAYFEGCTHGFAVRGDLSVPAIKKGKEESFVNTVKWFQKYL